jgi:glycosyltransferase involved in cell wall biosynthesis
VVVPAGRPVIMHFPGWYEGVAQSLQSQLSQHLGRLRPVWYVRDAPVDLTKRSLAPTWRPDGQAGDVHVITRTVTRNYARLARGLPWAAARVNGQGLARSIRTLGIGPCWLLPIGPSRDFCVPSRSWRLAADVNDPPFGVPESGAFAGPARQLRHAELVVATASAIVDGLGSYGCQARLLPNAVASSLIGAATAGRAPDPTAVFVGTLDWRFDSALAERVAELLPHVRFVFAGRVNPECAEAAQRLSSLANVEMRGRIDEADKVALLTDAHVGLVWFRQDWVGDCINPTKVYEYAAYGLPVVGGATRALREMAPPVLVGRTADEVAGEVERAIAGAVSATAMHRFARENTWEQRAAELDAWLRELELSTAR